MFKHRIALVLFVLTTAYISPAVAQTPQGTNIGITAGGAMAWAVFAPTQGPMRGGLAGTYVGASGAIGVGVGVGANLLFGGTGRSIALQPLSVEGSVGVN